LKRCSFCPQRIEAPGQAGGQFKAAGTEAILHGPHLADGMAGYRAYTQPFQLQLFGFPHQQIAKLDHQVPAAMGRRHHQQRPFSAERC